MPIVTFGSSKGGAGKSTLCGNIVVQHMANDANTILIDSDVQRSSSRWAALRSQQGASPAVTCFQKVDDTPQGNKSQYGQDILTLNKNYSSIFIDVAGRNSRELRGAMLVTDLLVYPVRVSMFDLWTLDDDMAMLSESRIANPNLLCMIVLNDVSPHAAKRVTEVQEAMEYLSQYLHPGMTFVAETRIHGRSCVKAVVSQGITVNEIARKDKSAKQSIDEFRGLYSEIAACFGQA
ncbi:division plane positioning ATPase MipZ [Azonexus hydrophilus]|uniref:Division plane positioning ATPase MipZ n=1 Tax=Azonexus hydrophilus TaxID=418702 RepID=A0ABZ2XQ90_9RHOO